MSQDKARTGYQKPTKRKLSPKEVEEQKLVERGDHRVIESFNWMTPDMKVNDAPGDKVIIRGPALFSVEKFFKQGLSRNQRRYIQKEVERSARTLTNVVIDVNHEISRWEEGGKRGPKPKGKGHVLSGEEEDGRAEYYGEVNNREYARKLRDTDKVRKDLMTEAEYKAKWGKGPISGVSVDAIFRSLTCPQCGKDFLQLENYKQHLATEHFIKNVEIQPRGIVFKRLSLVEPPESPGVVGADFEIVESINGMNRLYETVLKEGGFSMRKVGRTAALKLKEPEDQPPCGEGKHRDPETGECVPDKVEEQEEPCLEGEHRNEEGKCVPNEPQATEQEEQPVEEPEPPQCGEDEAYNPTTKQCEPIADVIQALPEIFKKGTKTQLKAIYEMVIHTIGENTTHIFKRLDALDKDTALALNLAKKDHEILYELYHNIQAQKENVLKESASQTVRIENLEAKLKPQFKGISMMANKEKKGHVKDETRTGNK